MPDPTQLKSPPATEPSGSESPGSLRRVLTMWDAAALMVGIVIGSGIFATPPSIAVSLDRFGPMISVWLVGGLLALCGALTYAELAAMFPRTGGAYIFLRETYGRAPAFIYGWSALLITYPASIAAVAVVFAAYLNRLVPLHPVPQSVVAAAMAVLMCGMNMLGVVLGTRVQRTFTAAKVVALVVLGGSAVFATAGQWSHLTPVWAAPSGGWSMTTWVLAMAAVMWTFEGWADGPTLSGEVRDKKRDLPRALLMSTLLVTVVYVLVNAAYVYVLSIPTIAASDSVAVDLAQTTFGSKGAIVVTLLVLVSTVGSVNGMTIAGSRVFFAMARDGLFFESVGRVQPRFKTPANSLAILAVTSAAYCLFGTFEQIIRYFVFVAMIWFVLVVLSVFLLRRRRPDAERPYRVPFYPITPAVFLLVAVGLMIQLYLANMRDATIGLVVLAASLPTYFAWRRWHGIRRQGTHSS
ncbi:MAG TPA: amino acid permease [candidate division Zixibacteria bacterium]